MNLQDFNTVELKETTKKNINGGGENYAYFFGRSIRSIALGTLFGPLGIVVDETLAAL
ncbi:hypothetical protein KUL113_49340 [Tenacibaculum sp. KUL113]|nr:hypothetical protein KUL113_49340 [Tenacibaculum sp. KUL113]